MQHIVIMNSPKEKKKSKFQKLIDKYTNELKIRKDNMSETGESLDDMERSAEERAIRKNAEFIYDLKSLIPKKKVKKKPLFNSLEVREDEQ